MRKAPSYELFSVRIGNNVDRLRFVLQGPNDIVQKLLAVGEEGGYYVLTRRTYRHAISGLVVGAERQALPHGDRLGPRDIFAVIVCAFAVRDLLHPVVESAHELAVVVGVAGREIELTV